MNKGEKSERCGASQISDIIGPNTGCLKLPQTGDSTNEIYIGWR